MDDGLITFDPKGNPLIAGTNMTVAEVLRAFATLGTVDRMLAAHPELTRAAIRAALEFAADTMRHV